MSEELTLEDIDDKVRGRVYVQDYTRAPLIEGVQVVHIQNRISEEGDFSEVLRIKEGGEIEQFPGFKIAQINRTRLNAGRLKAWHVHFKQDEIWYVLPSDSLFVGLWDIRKSSKTCGATMRMVLGGDSRLLFVPAGVAHGVANFIERPVELFYFVNKQFDSTNPDERRINWDALGSDFWVPKRD